MNVATHRTDVTHEEKQEFNSIISSANTLEELDAAKKPEGFPFGGTSEMYFEHMQRVMRERLEGIRTPEQVLEAHMYFKNYGTYSSTIQKELGEIAKKIIEDLHPPQSGHVCIRD